MNFKDWEKLAEDDKTVTMRHPKGHTMTIAIKALPKIQQEQIKRLNFAKGGDVLDSGEDGVSEQGRDVRHAKRLKERGEDPSKHEGQAKEEAKGRAKFSRMLPKPKLRGLAKGGEVKYDRPDLAKKGQASLEAKHSAKDTPETREYNKAFYSHANHMLKPRSKYAEGTPEGTVEEPQAPEAAPSTVQPGGNPITINVGTPQAAQPVPVPVPVAPPVRPQAPKPFQLPQAVNPAVQMAEQPVDVKVPEVPAGRPNLNPNGTMNPSAVAENTQMANEAQKNISTAKAQEDDRREGAYINAEAQLQQQRANRLGELSQTTDQAAAAILDPRNNNPRYYQENMGSGQKVATGIGLFLGGWGTAYGGHNYAMDFLNKQIDRDIEGQKMRVDHAKTVLGAYQDLYGKGVAADNMTKATMIDIYNAQVRQAAAKLGTPQAAQAAQAFGAQAAIDKSKALQDAAVDLNSLPGTRSGAMQQRGGSNQGQSPQAPGRPQGKSGAGVSSSWEEGKEKLNTYSILSPDAEGKLNNLRYTPKAKEEIDQIKQQYTQAKQAEKVLNGPNGDGIGGIHDLLQRMYKNSGEGSATAGIGGHVRRSVEETGYIPYVGEAARAITDLVPKSAAHKEYQMSQNTLETDLATALQGLVAPTDIQRIVRSNLPAYLDTPDMMAKKEQQIVNMVIKAAKTSLLDNWKLTPGKHK